MTLGTAFFLMKDLGFTPVRGASPMVEMRKILKASIDSGWRRPPIRWVMLAAPFTMGVGIFAFYAMQPYLLELYGDPTAYGVAGLAAAIVAGAQILGGMAVPLFRRVFSRRTDVLIVAGVVSVGALAMIAWTSSFWVAIAMLVLWAIAFSAAGPMRQAYVNGLISSEHRATVLSFDALMASSGGVVAQPGLGRVADVWGYSASYAVGAVISVAAIPFFFLARRERAESDPITATVAVPEGSSDS